MIRTLLRGGKNFSVITFCNVGVQIVSLVSFTLVARLYSLEAVGQYLIYLSYVSIAVIVSTGFYEQALFVDLKKRRQPYILLAVLSVAACTALLTLFVVLFVAPGYAFFVSLSVLAGAVRVVARSYGIVNGRLSQVAMFDLLASPVVPLFLICGPLLFNQQMSFYLIVVNSLVSFAMGLTLLLFVIKLDRFSFNYSAGRSLYLAFNILKRYVDLPKFKMTSELVGVLTLRLPLFVIDRFFTAGLAAFYGVAFRIAITPLTVVTSTLSQMFIYRVRSNKGGAIDSYGVFVRYSIGLLGLSLFTVAAIFSFSDWLVVLLFTEKYSYVPHILKLLSPYVAILIMVSPLMGTFVIYERQSWLLVFKLLLLLLSTIGYTVAVMTRDIDYGFLIFSISSVFVYGGAYFLMFGIYRFQQETLIKNAIGVTND